MPMTTIPGDQQNNFRAQAAIGLLGPDDPDENEQDRAGKCRSRDGMRLKAASATTPIKTPTDASALVRSK